MEIVDNTEARRFEGTIDGHRAELTYRRHGNRLVLIHTEVPEELEGNGLGGALITAAIDDAAEHSLTVVPQCPFARSWLKRHPEIAARSRIDWHA
ncbi:MAG TPA: GNAT family N-acetyltransferase [Acidimicrobiia bacterium]